MATWTPDGIIAPSNSPAGIVTKADIWTWSGAVFGFVETIPAPADVKKDVVYGANNQKTGTLISGGTSWS